MLLLYIAIGILLCVLLYLGLIYYFLFCKEKPLKEHSGVFNISSTDPEFYFPTKKSKLPSGKTLAVAGLLIAPTRRHKSDKNEHRNDEVSQIHRDAFPDHIIAETVASLDLTDETEKKSDDVSFSYHTKEEKSVHFEDEPMSHSSCYEGSTYQRSEEVDNGYGTLSGGNDTGNGSYYHD